MEGRIFWVALHVGGTLSEPVGPPSVGRRRLQRLRTHAKGAALFFAGLGLALAALLVYDAVVPDPPRLTAGEVNDSIVKAIEAVTPAPAFSARVYQVIRPSLVFIQTQTVGEEGEEGFGVGSGVVVNLGGDILTSLHVVEDALEVEVTFADGTQSRAEIVAAQPENDIAVLRAAQPPPLLVPALLGNPNALRVGDEAYVVGNPLGLYSSMSAGVISGFDRSFRPQDSERRLEGLIQIDAAVNRGNSGGPLLDRYGRVVGIVTALANPTDQHVFIGIGFAVPIDVAGAAAGMPPY
jgi:S1-C subfamily serine protease